MQLSASLLVVLMFLPSAAREETAAAALPSVDVGAATGWFAADRSLDQECCSSWSSSLFKGVSAGYYWTEHLKTEVEAAAPGPTEGFTSRSDRVTANLFRYTSEQHRISATRLSLSQAYQFGHNSNFHPFVRAGVDVDWEHDDVERYVQTAGAFEEQHSSARQTRTRPFAGVGFKAYFNERTFFKGEARFTPARGTIDQMAWTAGVGIDLGGRRRAIGTPADAQSKAPASPVRAPEPIERWRDYATHLKIGDRVEVASAGGRRFIADLVAVD